MRAQIGSHLIHAVAATPDSSTDDRQRIKIVTEYLERTYDIAHGEKLIFGAAPIQGTGYTSDITQSLAFTAFLISPDQVTDMLTKLSEEALRPYSIIFSNAQKLAVASSESFDPNMNYTQILQEYTQSKLDHGRPEFTKFLDGKPHDPTHRAICAYRDLIPKEKAALLNLLET